MGPETVMLIKILSDVAMTAMKTISEIDKMTEEEVKSAIRSAEQASADLLKRIKEH